MSTRRWLTGSCAAVLLLAAGCGDDDSDSGGDDSEQVTTPDTGSGDTEAGSDGGELIQEPMSDADSGAIDAAAATFLETQAANGVTGFYVGVWDPAKGAYVQAYGDASTDGPAATVDDSFRIGSITKTFTATVILQLVEEGQIALDDTVGDLVPDLADEFSDLAALTVQELLSMTSGVPDYVNVPDAVVADAVDDPTRVWETGELIAAGVGAGVSAPGTPGYSTTNYLVLQEIAEEVTGSTLQDLIAERVTDPLSLGSIFLPPDDDTGLPDPPAHGYIAGECVAELAADGATVDEGTDATDWSASYGQGGGGMTSDISDLGVWASTMTGNSLLDDELAGTRLDVSDIGIGAPYGLGIMKVGIWYGHEGEAIGWEAFALHDPDTGVTVALAGNGCGGLIFSFAAFLDTLYPDGAASAGLFGG